MIKLWKITALIAIPLFVLGGCVSGDTFPFESVQEIQSLIVWGQINPCPSAEGKYQFIQMVIIDKEPMNDIGSFYVLWSTLQEPGLGRFLLLQYDKKDGSPMSQVWEGIYLVENGDEIRLPEPPAGQKYDPTKHEDPCQALGVGSLTIKL